MTTATPRPLGYWFRFGPSHKRLHVTRFDQSAESVEFATACGAAVVAPAYLIDGAKLGAIKATAVEALQAADRNQIAHLCPSCRALFTAPA